MRYRAWTRKRAQSAAKAACAIAILWGVPGQVAGQSADNGAVIPVEATAPADPTQDPAGPPATADDLQVSLVTIGQGAQLWDSFGHNALLIENLRTGQSMAYDWGRFSFDQEGFYKNLAMGRMQYQMGWLDPRVLFSHYEDQNRTITVQRLRLSPAAKVALVREIEANAADPQYRYEYFLNNCSTRVRDLIDEASGGALARGTSSPEENRRYHTRRLTQHNTPLWAGFDVLLGPRGDDEIQRWDALFTPLELVEAVREIQVPTADGTMMPLVAQESVIYEAQRDPEPESPRRPLAFFLIFGLVLGGLLAWLGWASRGTGVAATAARAGAGIIAGAWSGLSGLVGVALVFVLATDHVWMHWNENVMQFSPVSLVLAGALILAPFWRKAAGAVPVLAGVTLALSALGFLLQILPGIDQGNGELIALALPIHLGLFLGVRALAQRHTTTVRSDANA